MCPITKHNYFRFKLFYFSLSTDVPVFKISEEQVAMEAGLTCPMTGARIVINSGINMPLAFISS